AFFVRPGPKPARRRLPSKQPFSIGFLPLHPEAALLLRSGRRASSPAFGSNVPISPSPAQRDKGLFSSHRQQRPEPALLLRSGRRWREAPDEGASEASCCCSSRQHQRHASLRSRPLIRPAGTFSREREKGFFPSLRQQRPDQPFSCAAGQGLVFQSPAATSGTSPSPAQREKVARSAG